MKITNCFSSIKNFDRPIIFTVSELGRISSNGRIKNHEIFMEELLSKEL